MKKELNDYLAYLSVLAQLQGSGHYVNEEIKEALQEVRKIIGLK